MKKEYPESISNEELTEMAIGACPGGITVVDTPELVESACAVLSRCRHIGFDTETRPSFTKGVFNKVALLQLSSGEQTFLFRLNRIGLPDAVCRLFESKENLKIGVAVNDDVRGLRSLHRFNPHQFIELQNVAPRYGIMEKSLRKLAAIVLNIRISKAQRLSNWEAKVLTPAQQLYAATDAWVGRAIYEELVRYEPSSETTTTTAE